MRLSKSTNEQRHAMQRCSERYGLTYDRTLREQMLAAIRNGRSRPIRRQSLRVVIHDVTIGDRQVRVAYDNKRGEIITFLPETKKATDGPL